MLAYHSQASLPLESFLEYEEHASGVTASYMASYTESIYETELLLQDTGRTILNETIEPHENTEDSADKTDLDEEKLHLREVDFKFSKVLPSLHTITEDYANTPLVDAFNWAEVAELLGVDAEGDWYIVAFRSIRRADANSKLLYDADAAAHEEAKKSGGLLKYWYGTLNENRECLAMCIWVNRDFARLATRKPLHVVAMKLAGRMYDTYDLERYTLRKWKGSRNFEVLKW